jgi:hypothetical protein
MTDQASDRQADLDSFLRRERLFRRFTWLATLVPIALFVVFIDLTTREIRKYEGFRDQNSQLQSQIAAKKAELDAVSKTLADREFALEVARQNSSGPRPSVVFYRVYVADQIQQALGQSGLGYHVELSDYPGNPSLKDRTPDAVEYGCAVISEDIRAISLALVGGKLPVRRIAPATKLYVNKPMLVQYISTVLTDQNKPSLSPEQIQQWTRPDKPCPTPGKVTSAATAPH